MDSDNHSILPRNNTLSSCIVFSFSFFLLLTLSGCQYAQDNNITACASSPRIQASVVNEQTTALSKTESAPNTGLESDSPIQAEAAEDEYSKSSLLLEQILDSAQAGKIIECDYSVKANTASDVEEDWGKPDSAKYADNEKCTYSVYSNRCAAFGYSNSNQIIEIRSFDQSLGDITLAETTNLLGEPAYDVITPSDEKIIGYEVNDEFKLLFVFDTPTNANTNPPLKYYSLLYPEGTADSENGEIRHW